MIAVSAGLLRAAIASALGSLVFTAFGEAASPRRISDVPRIQSQASTAGATTVQPCSQPAENCRPPIQFDALISNRANFRTADNFTPITTGTVNQICWWGAYLAEERGPCESIDANAFEIRYFEDAGGVPGALIASYSQAAGTLRVAGPVATGEFIDGDVDEFAYTAAHAAILVTAGAQYWVEISNVVSGCTWFWETAATTESRAMQDGTDTPEPAPPNGYGPEDVILNDLALCLNLPLPPPPANNLCEDAEIIFETGEYSFENTFASTDGPGHASCDIYGDGQRQLTHDVWYCWTSPCTDMVFARTCELTTVDTRLAVYRGCHCPASNQTLEACDDDLCGFPFDNQSMVRFAATAGQSYMIRVGTYPLALGGEGSFEISCGSPSQEACGAPDSGSCCDPKLTGGCADNACCESVCACDGFCCEVAWDEDCAGLGFNASGCGAAALCDCKSVCGAVGSTDCCVGGNTPGCSDPDCCERVCQCDSYCCDVEWDNNCATFGFENECGAAILCQATCNPTCPTGPVRWLDPPQTVLDARRPFTPTASPIIEGIQELHVVAPLGADKAECWSLCETASAGGANRVSSIAPNIDGSLTIALLRPITRFAVTKITYRDDKGAEQVAEWTSHPSNANGDGFANETDVAAMVEELLEISSLLPGLYSRDIDRSGQFNAADLLELIDLLNGAGAYPPTLNTPKPVSGSFCP